MDDTTTVAALRRAVHDFVDARDWYQHHTPKNLAMSIAIETAELMEHFQWYTPAEAEVRIGDPTLRHEIGEELADILLYCLSFANATGIEIADVVKAKMERNESRFPVQRVRGKLG